ncbi:lantibiotic dehydratase [Nocardiopsis alba]|uniref:lantibiotic dehydratase n=1 Tax=Nocardiopsis alba TaxID=53437 RepID=UPI00365CE887
MSTRRTASGTDRPVWTLVPTLVVRSAGFPTDLLEGLRFHRTTRLLEEIETAQAAGRTLCEERPPPHNLPRKFRARLLGFRPLPADAPVDAAWAAQWNAVAKTVTELRELLTDAVASDTAAVNAAVDAVAGDPRVRDAVACSSPPVLRDLRSPVTGARAHRQVASYVQRLAAKSETMSFFGPINYARLHSGDPSPSRYLWAGHRELADRRAHPAARVVHALVDACVRAEEHTGDLVVRRKTWLGEVGPRRAGSPVAERVLAALTGPPERPWAERGIRELTDELGAPAEEVRRAVQDLVARGLLTPVLTPPATVPHPLGSLREHLAEYPGDHPVRDPLERITALLESHPAAPAEDKPRIHGEIQAVLNEVTSGDGRIGPARTDRFYNDRVIVHEAARGTLDVHVSGDLARDLTEGMAPVLDLLAHEAELTRLDTNRALARALGRGRFPLLSVMRRCGDLSVRWSHWISDRIEQHVRASQAPGDGAFPIGEGIDLSELFDPPPRPALPLLCSIDVMPCVDDLARYRAGATPIVVGDVHDAALLTPWALDFHADRDAALGERDELIGEALGDVGTVCVVSQRTTGLPPLRFPGSVLELGGTVPDADDHRLGVDELVVESDGCDAVLRHRAGGDPLHFHNGELDSGVHTALALPRIRRPNVRGRALGPRLRRGNVVLLRASRTVPSSVFLPTTRKPGPVEHRMAEMSRIRAEYGLPNRFFAKSPHERKPLYVDTAAPSLVAGLTRLAGTAEELRLSEVLPDRDQHWLRDGDAVFTSEFRCVYLSPGGER